jgi:hypothetical protein
MQMDRVDVHPIDEEFARQERAKLRARFHERTKAGELIWHYTTWEALKGIVNNRNIRLTHFAYLKDASEIKHFLERAQEILPKELFGRTHYHIDLIRDDKATLTPVYIASFSKEFDSLAQWRAYSSTSIGVALGFDRHRLESIARQREFRLHDCVYGKAKADAFLQDEAQKRARQVEVWDAIDKDERLSDADRFGAMAAISRSQPMLTEELLRQAPRFKDGGFEHEHEVRLIAAPGYEEKMHFIPKGELLVPYIELELPEPAGQDGAVTHPLEAICLAPGHSPLTAFSVEAFMGAARFARHQSFVSHPLFIVSEHPERR